MRGLAPGALFCVLLMALPFADAAAAQPASLSAVAPVTQVVAILVYHRFAIDADDSMTVRVDTFNAHLAFLREHGYRIVPLRDIVAWVRDGRLSLPPKAVALSVDDGHRSVYDVLLPIVQRERIPVTLFVYPSAISNASYALTWDQLRALQASGWFDVQSHTWWHPNFRIERRRQRSAEFRQFARTQLVQSRELIQHELGGRVDMIAWPFGLYDDELLGIAGNAGYTAGFTIEARRVRAGDAPLALPRFLMVDACTARTLGALLGEPSGASATGATGARR